MCIFRRPVCLERRSKVSCPSWFAETIIFFSFLLPSWSSFFSTACAEIAQVLKPYSSSSPELLNLENGQLILILSKNASGWWLGELQVRASSPFVLICDCCLRTLLTLTKNNNVATSGPRQKASEGLVRFFSCQNTGVKQRQIHTGATAR